MRVVFRRTNSGLKNQHLFYNVDFVVFVEGGKNQYNKDDVLNLDKFNKETEDTLFWSNIFSTFRDSKKFKFKSIGSKSVVKSIAQDVIYNNINTTLVAMDNEFDEILKKRTNHPNVFYTYGYSWENDVWNPKVIKSVIEELTAVKIDHTDIEDNFSSFVKDLKLAVYADGYLFRKNLSFFPRKNGRLFCVNCNTQYLPHIKKDKINEKLASKGIKKENLYSYGSRHKIRIEKFCYGHLLSGYCIQLILHYISTKHSLKNISKEIINRMGINKYFSEFFNNGEIYDYYKQQFKKNAA